MASLKGNFGPLVPGANVAAPRTPGESSSATDPDKQVFVLTNAGKPVFSLGVPPERVSSLVGLIRALLAYGDAGVLGPEADQLQSVVAGDLKMVLRTWGALHFVAVSRRRGDSVAALQLQLEVLNHEVLSLLTTQVHDTLRRKPTTDIRGLLGADAPMRHLLTSVEGNMSLAMDAVPTLCLSPQLRAEVQRILGSREAQVATCLCTALCCRRALLGFVQMKRPDTRLWASDLILAMNFVVSQRIGVRGEETWTPLCLPRFRADVNVQVYIANLDADANIYLLMISHDNTSETFDELRRSRLSIQEALRRDNALRQLVRFVAQNTQASAHYNHCKEFSILQFFYKRHAVAPPNRVGGVSSVGKSAAPAQCIFHGFYFPFIDSDSKRKVWMRYHELATRLRNLRASQDISTDHEPPEESIESLRRCDALETLGTLPDSKISVHCDSGMTHIALTGSPSGSPQGAAWELYCTTPAHLSIDSAVTQGMNMAKAIHLRDDYFFIRNTSVW